MIFPFFNPWIDMIIICVVYSLIVKAVQHFLVNPKDYILVKLKSKKLNKEMQALVKEQKLNEAQEKQKESMQLMQKQMSFSFKPMFVLMIVALPLLWFVRKYYGELNYNFLLFNVNGFWAYIIIAMIVSLIVSNIYDKKLENYYKEDFEKNCEEELAKKSKKKLKN